MASFVEQYERVLGQRGRISGDECIFYCPFEGCVGYDKPKFYVNVRTGAWQCKHCHQIVPGKVYRETCREPHGGTWREFVRLMGDEENLYLWLECNGNGDDPTPEVTPLSPEERERVWSVLFEFGRLTNDHREELADRGIDGIRARMVSASYNLIDRLTRSFDPDILISAGLFYRREEGGDLLPRRAIRPGRILIPYYRGGRLVYFVGYQRCPEKRPDQLDRDYLEMKRHWIKVAGPAGYPAEIYGEVEKGAPFVFITEGQIKAISAIQRGLPCLGLMGMSNAHRQVATYLRQQRVENAIIVFDTEPESQEIVDYEAEKLARELLRRKIGAIRIILPAEPGIKKVDLDEYLLKHTVFDLARLLESAHIYEFGKEAEPVQ